MFVGKRQTVLYLSRHAHYSKLHDWNECLEDAFQDTFEEGGWRKELEAYRTTPTDESDLHALLHAYCELEPYERMVFCEIFFGKQRKQVFASLYDQSQPVPQLPENVIMLIFRYVVLEFDSSAAKATSSQPSIRPILAVSKTWRQLFFRADDKWKGLHLQLPVGWGVSRAMETVRVGFQHLTILKVKFTFYEKKWNEDSVILLLKALPSSMKSLTQLHIPSEWMLPFVTPAFQDTFKKMPALTRLRVYDPAHYRNPSFDLTSLINDGPELLANMTHIDFSGNMESEETSCNDYLVLSPKLVRFRTSCSRACQYLFQRTARFPNLQELYIDTSEFNFEQLALSCGPTLRCFGMGLDGLSQQRHGSSPLWLRHFTNLEILELGTTKHCSSYSKSQGMTLSAALLVQIAQYQTKLKELHLGLVMFENPPVQQMHDMPNLKLINNCDRYEPEKFVALMTSQAPHFPRLESLLTSIEWHLVKELIPLFPYLRQFGIRLTRRDSKREVVRHWIKNFDTMPDKLNIVARPQHVNTVLVSKEMIEDHIRMGLPV